MGTPVWASWDTALAGVPPRPGHRKLYFTAMCGAETLWEIPESVQGLNKNNVLYRQWYRDMYRATRQDMARLGIEKALNSIRKDHTQKMEWQRRSRRLKRINKTGQDGSGPEQESKRHQQSAENLD